jgi:hypothetical protein
MAIYLDESKSKREKFKMEMVSIHDWMKFRSLETLPQKAGVSRDKLGLLVAKELADNALDHCGQCEVGYLASNGFYVKDNGEGIDPALLPELFSINRPFMSSKILRLPTRGALGNGLRVVSGSVIATGGTMHVSTRGKRYQIQFQPDGTSIAEMLGDYPDTGTTIEIQYGLSLKADLAWAESAIYYNRGEGYKSKSSGYWYTSEAFYELCQGSKNTINKLITEFDGCTGTKGGTLANDYKGQLGNSLSFDETENLLGIIRNGNKNVNPDRLKGIGEIVDYGYSKSNGNFTVRSARGNHNAEIPYIVEVWVDYNRPAGLDFLINKSPITGQMKLYSEKTKTTLWGCGLFSEIKMKPSDIVINILTPYMPIVSDGKEPDLKQMESEIVQSIKKAASRAMRNVPKVTKKFEKDIILDNLQAAINKASDNGRLPFSLRQLYYAIRPYIITGKGKQLEYGYFCGVVTDYEAEQADIPKMYRDNRGVLYCPHTGQEIPIGTVTVQEYRRPEWTFNKILYSEKEGLFPLLKAAGFPERYDCALVTSKGYASRAVKDLLDMLGETDEELQFFCIHDADAAGTKIFETLQEATKARPERKVKIINLGLDPWEAMDMGLEIEELTKSKDKKPVAAYVPTEWNTWLQTNRIELNAMTSDQFVTWLERKFDEYNNGKVIPDSETLSGNLESTVRERVEQEIRERILREAGYEAQVSQRMSQVLPILNTRNEVIQSEVRDRLDSNRELHWKKVVTDIGKRMEL